MRVLSSLVPSVIIDMVDDQELPLRFTTQRAGVPEKIMNLIMHAADAARILESKIIMVGKSIFTKLARPTLLTLGGSLMELAFLLREKTDRACPILLDPV
jgi:hypothetical protein